MRFVILQWNIKGYTNNYNELLSLIHESHPQIIALQETHITNHSSKIIPIPINYLMYNHNTHAHYGGAAILIHKSVEHKFINHSSTFDLVKVNVKMKKI